MLGSRTSVAESAQGGPLRVLVFGGRYYDEAEVVWVALNWLLLEHGRLVVVEGGATGADRHAQHWAVMKGQPRVGLITVEADWARFGDAAGPMRNAEMLLVHKPDVALEAPGGSGTADMRARCLAAGLVPIRIGGKLRRGSPDPAQGDLLSGL